MGVFLLAALAAFHMGDLVVVLDGQVVNLWDSNYPNSPPYILHVDLQGLSLAGQAQDPTTRITSRTSVLVGPDPDHGYHAVSVLPTWNILLLEELLPGNTGRIVVREPDGDVSRVIRDGLAHDWSSFESGLFQEFATQHVFTPSAYWHTVTTSYIDGVPADGRSKFLELDSQGGLVRYYSGDPNGKHDWYPDGAALNRVNGELLVSAATDRAVYRFARTGTEGPFLGVLYRSPGIADYGNGEGWFSGLAVDPDDGRVFVAEFEGDYTTQSQIWELSATGTLARAFTVSAAVAASLKWPVNWGGMSFDPSGRYLAVVDYFNDEVFVFDTDALVDDRRPVVARFGWADQSSGFTFSSVSFVPGRPPVAAAGADRAVECTSPAGAPVALDASASTDPDGDLASYRWREGATTLASEAAATVTLSIAAHDVVLEVTDATHLTTEDTAVITVGDTTAPVLAAPTNVHAECAAHGGTAVTLGTPVANDACDAAPAVTVAGIPDGAIFPLGETAVIWKAKDAHQNEATASQSVVIADSTPPVLSGVPGPMSEEATSEAGASLTLAVPTAADVCDPAPAVTSDAPAIFPVGITVVTFTARDASGNSATATTEVTVTALDRGVRTAPPSCLCGPGAVSPGWALAALAGLALRRRPRRPGR